MHLSLVTTTLALFSISIAVGVPEPVRRQWPPVTPCEDGEEPYAGPVLWTQCTKGFFPIVGFSHRRRKLIAFRWWCGLDAPN
jgi:hypothetical protein